MRLADVHQLSLSADRNVYCHRACGPEIRRLDPGNDVQRIDTANCRQRRGAWKCDLNGWGNVLSYRVVCQPWDAKDEGWIAVGTCALEYAMEPMPSFWSAVKRVLKVFGVAFIVLGAFGIAVLGLIFFIYVVDRAVCGAARSTVAERQRAHLDPDEDGSQQSEGRAAEV